MKYEVLVSRGRYLWTERVEAASERQAWKMKRAELAERFQVNPKSVGILSVAPAGGTGLRKHQTVF